MASHTRHSFDLKTGCAVLGCNGLVPGLDASDACHPAGQNPVAKLESFLRAVVLPELNRDTEVRIFFLRACSDFWMPLLVEPVRDLTDWTVKLTTEEQHLIVTAIGLYAAIKGVEAEFVMQFFIPHAPSLESRWYFTLQLAIADVHMEAGMRFLVTYIRDPNHRQWVWRGAQGVSYLGQRDWWARRWLYATDAPFAFKLAALLVWQTVLSSSTFLILRWLEHCAVLPALAQFTRLVTHDVGNYACFARALFRRQTHRPCVHNIRRMVIEAVAVEKNFDGLHIPSVGLGSYDMGVYSEYIADRVLEALGVERLFHSQSPFGFAELLPLSESFHFFAAQSRTSVTHTQATTL